MGQGGALEERFQSFVPCENPGKSHGEIGVERRMMEGRIVGKIDGKIGGTDLFQIEV